MRSKLTTDTRRTDKRRGGRGVSVGSLPEGRGSAEACLPRKGVCRGVDGDGGERGGSGREIPNWQERVGAQRDGRGCLLEGKGEPIRHSNEAPTLRGRSDEGREVDSSQHVRDDAAMSLPASKTRGAMEGWDRGTLGGWSEKGKETDDRREGGRGSKRRERGRETNIRRQRDARCEKGEGRCGREERGTSSTRDSRHQSFNVLSVMVTDARVFWQMFRCFEFDV